jgi:hypothetical protein
VLPLRLSPRLRAALFTGARRGGAGATLLHGPPGTGKVREPHSLRHIRYGAILRAITWAVAHTIFRAISFMTSSMASPAAARKRKTLLARAAAGEARAAWLECSPSAILSK